MIKKKSSQQVWEQCYNEQNHYVEEEDGGDLKYDRVLFNNVKLIFKNGLSGIKILDIGAGKGEDIVNFAKNGASAYAMDFSSMAFNLLKRNSDKYGVNVYCTRADTNKIPYKDEVFDIVYSKGLMEHFKNMSFALKEQIRILKNSGYIIVEIPNKYTLYTIKKQIDKILGRWKFGFEREYSLNQVKNIFRKFEIRYINSYGELLYPDIHLIEKYSKIKIPLWVHFIFNKIKEKLEHSSLSAYLCLGGWNNRTKK